MYILKCADGSLYVGSTRNLDRRLWEHQNGLGANYTKKRLPVSLIFAEEFERVDEAYFREKQIQGWNRSKKLALAGKDWNKIKALAECGNDSHCRNRPSTPLGERPS